MCFLVTADGNCLLYSIGKALHLYNILPSYATFHMDLRWFVTEVMDEYFGGMKLMESSEAYCTEQGVMEDGYKLRNDREYMESTYFFVRMCFVLQINFNMIGAFWKVVKNEKTGRRTQKCALVEHRYTFKRKEWEDWNGQTQLPKLIFDWRADAFKPALNELKEAGGFWAYVDHEKVEFDGVQCTIENHSRSNDVEQPAQHLDIGSAFRCRKGCITIGIDRVWYDPTFEYHHCFLHDDSDTAREIHHFDHDQNSRLKAFFVRLKKLCTDREKEIKANAKSLRAEIRASTKAEKATMANECQSALLICS